jgi:ribulose-5-phosphate 4-epimerase/fuculose-1-phosphate aldolase
MKPIFEIYRARIDPANVDRLMEIRAAAVAEFQEQMPELLQAHLVRLEGDVWLDVLLWSEPVDDERISKAASAAPISVEMHALITDVLAHDRGEIVHSTAWATAR